MLLGVNSLLYEQLMFLCYYRFNDIEAVSRDHIAAEHRKFNRCRENFEEIPQGKTVKNELHVIIIKSTL